MLHAVQYCYLAMVGICLDVRDLSLTSALLADEFLLGRSVPRLSAIQLLSVSQCIQNMHRVIVLQKQALHELRPLIEAPD